jgi:N-acetylglucosaminyldiphosphoundecaprenol N-acetyl-beta-D-mannosaminyltransferase
MGMPRQEHWILNNFDRIQTDVFMPVGALIEYFAGVMEAPPRWMGRIGLEWLFRLITHPERYAVRYVLEPWMLAGVLAWRQIRRVSAALRQA